MPWPPLSPSQRNRDRIPGRQLVWPGIPRAAEISGHERPAGSIRSLRRLHAQFLR